MTKPGCGFIPTVPTRAERSARVGSKRASQNVEGCSESNDLQPRLQGEESATRLDSLNALVNVFFEMFMDQDKAVESSQALTEMCASGSTGIETPQEIY